MALTVTKNQSNPDYEPVPENTYVGICIGVVDIGRHLNSYGKLKQKVLIIWELVGTQVSNEDTRPRIISKPYTLSLHDNSQLTKDLKSWRGRPFVEREQFQVPSMLGVAGYIQIIHDQAKDGSGKVFANVNTIMPLPPGLTVPPPINPFMVFDLDEWLTQGADEEHESWKALYPWIQNKVKESQQYKDYVAGIYNKQVPPAQAVAAPTAPPPPPPMPAIPPQQHMQQQAAASDALEEGELPF